MFNFFVFYFMEMNSERAATARVGMLRIVFKPYAAIHLLHTTGAYGCQRMCSASLM